MSSLYPNGIWLILTFKEHVIVNQNLLNLYWQLIITVLIWMEGGKQVKNQFLNVSLMNWTLYLKTCHIHSYEVEYNISIEIYREWFRFAAIIVISKMFPNISLLVWLPIQYTFLHNNFISDIWHSWFSWDIFPWLSGTILFKMQLPLWLFILNPL